MTIRIDESVDVSVLLEYPAEALHPLLKHLKGLARGIELLERTSTTSFFTVKDPKMRVWQVVSRGLWDFTFVASFSSPTCRLLRRTSKHGKSQAP